MAEHVGVFNVFRILGDLSHLFSFLFLLASLLRRKSCRGISLRTLEVYLVVFSCRYVDLFWNFGYLYNWVMKVLFLGASAYAVFLMRGPLRASYERAVDVFPRHYVLLPPAGVAFVYWVAASGHHSLFELLWAYSIVLESVAVLPQLTMLQRQGEADRLPANYIFSLGGYRLLYFFNWIYRSWAEPHHQHVTWLVVIFGLVQSALYLDFFYYFVRAKYFGTRLYLPGGGVEAK